MKLNVPTNSITTVKKLQKLIEYIFVLYASSDLHANIQFVHAYPTPITYTLQFQILMRSGKMNITL